MPLPNKQAVIFAEHNNKDRFSLSAETTPDGLFLSLVLRDTNTETKCITMTNHEFDRLAKEMGYTKS